MKTVMQPRADSRSWQYCLQVPALVPAATLRLEVARVAARNSRLMGRVLPPPHLPRTDSAAFGHVSTLLAWAQVLHHCPANSLSRLSIGHAVHCASL